MNAGTKFSSELHGVMYEKSFSLRQIYIDFSTKKNINIVYATIIKIKKHLAIRSEVA